MKVKSLQFGKAMSAALFVLLLNTVGWTKTHAENITFTDSTYTAIGMANGDQVTINHNYADLSTFEYDGHTYKVAPDPQQSFSEFTSWSSAYSYCENLTAYGYSDWRMPTIEELEMMYQNRTSIGGFVQGSSSYDLMFYHSASYINSSVGHYKLAWVTGERIGDANLENSGYLNYNSGSAIYYCRAHVRPIRVHLELPTVTMDYVNYISQTNATCWGSVTDEGGATVTERGFCWSTNHNPTIYDNSSFNHSTGTGSFSHGLTNLMPGTQYYVRAYATNSVGTAYSNELSFTTTCAPTVTTNNVTNIGPSSATCGGNVTNEGSGAVTARGVCWSTGHNPGIYSNHTNDGTGAGSYTSIITGLNAETQYYVRAYATNSEGTSYGDEISFVTTKWLDVTTNDVIYITQTSATCGGYVTAYNGATVTARGVCWSSSNQNPTISDSYTTDGTGIGNFTSNLIGLTQNTTYYVRAYATCSGGTFYGETKQFNTTKLSYRISEGGVIATSAGGYFYDSGGPNNDYGYNEHYIMTFTSNQGTGTKIRMTFTDFWTYSSNDYLVIYDGMNTSASVIGTYSWTHSPGTVTASNSDGALTFVFIADNDCCVGTGWEAAISIVTPSNTISVSANPSNGGTVLGGGGYENGEICTLTATPAAGYNFVKWTKNGTQISTNSTYTFTVSESASYVAHFSQNNYTISASASPSNGGTVTGGGTYSYGTNCTLTATANTGYTFVNWTKNGTVVSTNPSYSFTVSEAAMYVANFQQQQTQSYAINVLAYPTAGGTVTGGGTYNHGSSCTLTATPNAGYTFTNWEKGNTVISTNATYTFTVTEATSYTANFTLNSYAIAATANPTAGGTVSGAGTYNHGVTCTLTASANTGYTFVNWTESGTIVSTNAMYAFSVTNNRTLVANFQQQQSQNYAINVSANPTIGGSVAGGGTYTQGVTCTLTATANNGYAFVNWIENGTVVSTSSTYTFTVTGDRTLVAYFNQTNSNTIITFADENVKELCITNWDTDGDGELSYDEAATVTDLNYVFQSNQTIISFDELQYFTGVTEIKGYARTLTLPNHQFLTVYNGDFLSCSNLTSIVIPNSVVEIKSYAFKGCQGLVSLVIPGSITSIGTQSFCNCNGLISMTVYAETPPTLGSLAFSNVDKSIPVYVPVGKVAAYQAATGWNEFTNLQEIPIPSYIITATANPAEGGTVTGGGIYDHGANCSLIATANAGYTFINWTKDGQEVSTNAVYNFTVTEATSLVANFQLVNYDITAIANPAEGGTITGAGNYNYGQTCTLNATTNEGYTFTNWTENGVQVSTNSTYTFTVTGNRNLVANFEEVGDGYHWDVNIYTYPNTLIMVGVVLINGEEQATDMLEVGAFCNGECRGRERLSGQYYQVFGRYFVNLTVYGEDGDEISFRLYDHATEMELDLSCAPITFATNGVFGNPVNPHVFDFGPSVITQTKDFAEGWNWWSTYIDQTSIDGLTMLEEGLGDNGVTIKSQGDGFVQYMNYGGYAFWYGTLDHIANTQTYMVQTAAPVQVEMTGAPVSPADSPITISEGWNWIGFPSANAMDFNTAFSGITPSNNDIVKTQNSFAQYMEYGGYGFWYGGLNSSTITPGTGLMYKSENSESYTFAYPTTGRATATEATTAEKHWTNNVHLYPANMTVLAVVELNDIELRSDNYELAAFANGECRGSAKLMYVEPLNRYMAFLTVSGNEAAELHFGLYDGETGEENYTSSDKLVYATDATVGSYDEPMVVSFRSTTGFDDIDRNLQVYPNPVARGERFSINLPVGSEVRVDVVNALGAIVSTETSTKAPASLLAPNTAGVYTLRITVEGEGTYCRKLVVR